jgi:hypothetical protein
LNVAREFSKDIHQIVEMGESDVRSKQLKRRDDGYLAPSLGKTFGDETNLVISPLIDE